MKISFFLISSLLFIHITQAQFKYDTVRICNQTWMKKNLDVLTYRNGDSIPNVTDPTAWAALTTGAYCYYNNDSAYAVFFGKLYNWYAVNDSRGLAPTGWHIPSDAEWTTLETGLRDTSVAVGKLVVTDTTTWILMSRSIGASNTSGWAGIAGGNRHGNGSFKDVGDFGYWWSSTESTTTYAWYRYLYYNLGTIYRFNYDKRDGFSIRCLRD